MIYNGADDVRILEFASACAVAALSQVDAVSGLKSGEEIEKICNGLKRKELCL